MNCQQAKYHKRRLWNEFSQFQRNLKAFHDRRSSSLLCWRNFAPTAESDEDEAEEKRGRRSREEKRKGGRFAWIWSAEEKRAWSLVKRSLCLPPSRTRTLGTLQVWLCGGLVRLADRFTSIHHRRLTCAFTGRYRRLGHRLTYIMQRWLSVHGNF